MQYNNIPNRISDYQIGWLVRSGCFSQFYSAINTKTIQKVAVKIIPKPFDAKKEIRILQQLNHPKRIKFYEKAKTDQYFQSKTLLELINDNNSLSKKWFAPNIWINL
jgi:serine/threonine protein kinase